MAMPQIDTKPEPRPLRADAQRNRAAVLEAARECFGRDGLEAQMDDVAAKAGVGVGTVYRHFATKEALLEALAANYFANENALAQRALAVDDPWQAFAGFLREGAEELARNRALAQAATDRPELMQNAALAAQAHLGFFDTLEELIARAQEAGVLRGEFELSDIPAIMCSLGALQTSRNAYSNWRRVLEMVLDGLRTSAADELPPVLNRVPRGDVAP
jgi:AcrR family transcriptional regulator